MSFKGTLAFAENVPTKTGTGASGNWGISITGNATTATTATTATHLYSDGSGTSMIFHWSGQGGQPTWLWGGNSASDMYVYNPSNFSVNYAASSNITNTLSYLGLQTMDTSGTLTSGVQCYGVYINGYPTAYGNVLNIAGQGYGQILIGWSGATGAHADNYIRSLRDSAKGTNGWSDWAKIITSANYNTYALPLSGGTLTGLLTTNAGIASTTGTFSSTLAVTGTIHSSDSISSGGKVKAYGGNRGNILTLLFDGYFGYNTSTSSNVNSLNANSTGSSSYTYARTGVGQYTLTFTSPTYISSLLLCIVKDATSAFCVSSNVSTSGGNYTFTFKTTNDNSLADAVFRVSMLYELA